VVDKYNCLSQDPIAERVRASLRQQQARVGSCTPATEAMFESNDDAQERSDGAQNFDCPNCGDGLQAITRRGPTDATAQPCGCPIGHVDIQAFATTGVDA